MSALQRIINRARLHRDSKAQRKLAKKQAVVRRSQFFVESLEPRILLSGDVVPLALTADLNNAAGPAPIVLNIDSDPPASASKEAIAETLTVIPQLLASDPSAPLNDIINAAAAAATPISRPTATTFSTGIAGFADWLGTLGGYQQFAGLLPGIQQSFGDALKFQDTLRTRVFQPIASYVNADTTPTVEELQAALEGLDKTVNDLVFQSTVTNGGIFGTAGQQELRYDLVFNFHWTRPVGLDLGVAATDALYLLDATAQADFSLVLNLSLGVDLTAGLPADKAFFVRTNDVHTSFDLHVANLNAGIALGFLGADIHGGRIDATANVAAAISNPDGDALGRITLSELKSTPMPALVHLTGSGALTADLPFSAHLGSWTLTGNPRISLSLPDAFSGQAPQVVFNADTAPTLPFRTLNAGGVSGLLGQIASWGDAFNNTPRSETTLLDQQLPFANGRTLADLLNVGPAVREALLKPLQGGGTTLLPFRTAQELADKLAQILKISVDDTHLTYDEAKHELSYRIDFSHDFDPVTVPIDFNFDLKPLASLSSTGTVQLTSKVTGGMTFGITLAPFSATLVGLTPLPNNGHLQSEAIFELSVAGGAPLTVRVAADATNTSRADLVSDVNAALRAAGVPDFVTAGVNANGQLTLTAARTGSAVSLVVNGVNAGAVELGISRDSNALNSLADHAWVENAMFSGSVTLYAANFQASATLGFLEIEVTQGQASAKASVTAKVKDPKTGIAGGRVTIRSLLDAVSEDPLGSAEFQFTGSASASLQHIQVTDNFLGVIQGNPTVTVNWTDITNLSTLQVTPNGDMNPLRVLESFTADKVVDLLKDVRDWVVKVEESSFFNDKLPLINKTPKDLFKLSERFDKLVEKVRANVIKSIQKLEKALLDAQTEVSKEAGDPPAQPPAEKPKPKVTFANKILTIELPEQRDITSPETFSPKADLTSLGLPPELQDLVALKSEGQLNVTGKVNSRIVFGFDLNQVPTLFIRDDTNVDISLKVAASNMAFELALGPLGLFVINGSARLDDGAAAVADRKPATLVVTMKPDDTDHRYSFLEALSKFNVDLKGYAQTTLPLYFPTKNNRLAPDFVFTVADLGHPIASATVSGPNLGAVLSQLNLLSNLEALRKGWDELLGLVETLLKKNVFGLKFPLVGDQLSDTLDFIHRMRQQLQGNLGLLPSFTLTAVQQALFAGLGPAGLNWLQDRPNDTDTVVTAADIEALTDGNDFVQFNMVLAAQQQLLKADLDFDIGLPALGLDLDGAVVVGGAFHWDLRFGVSKKDGVYIDTSAGTEPEFKATFGATIPGFQAAGRLGFVETSAKDDSEHPSTFGGVFNIDFIAPSQQSTRLKLRDLQTNGTAWDKAFDVSLQAKAEINLELVTGFSEIGVLPSMEADFKLVWNFAAGDPDFKGSAPTVAFNNVRLNLGSFFASFASPILKRIQDVLRPIQPVIDALNTKVPVYSDLAREDLNFFQLAQRFGDPNQTQFVEFLSALADIITLVNSIPVIEGNQYILLGSFNLDGTDLRKVDSVEKVNPNPTETKDTVSQLTGSAKDFFDKSQNVGNRRMSFPILENPLQAFKLLLGQDVNLFLYDMPPLKYGFEHSWYFSVLPPFVFVELGGSIGAKLDLAFGYDTSGLREFAKTGYVSDVFDGFFVSDTLNADGTGADVPEVQFWANIYAALEVNFVVLWAGIEGGITATVNLNLKDYNNDGKVHAEEFLQTFDDDLLSTFDVSGALEAYLKWYVKAGYKDPFGNEIVLWEEGDEIARVTLADFRTPPDNPIWDGGGDGTSWSDPKNWSGDKIPTGSQNVIINVPDQDVTVVLPANVAASSIRSKETLVIGSTLSDAPNIESRNLIVTDPGRLTTRRPVDVDQLTLSAGGSMTIKTGGTVTVNQNAKLYGVIDAQGGDFTAAGGDVDGDGNFMGDGDGAAFLGNTARVFASAGAQVEIDAPTYSSTGLANATLFSVAGADTVLNLSALTEINAAFNDVYYDEVQTITATTGARINLSGLTKITGPVYSNDRLDIVMSGSTSTIDLPNLKSIVGAPTRFVLSGAATLNLPSLQSANNTLFALSGGAHLTATGPKALLYSSTGLANATLFSVAGADTILDLSALTEINAAFDDIYYDEVQTITATTGARINLSGLTKITGPVYSNDRLDIVMSGSTSTIDLPNLKSIVGAPTRFVLSGAATLNLPSLQSANNTLFALSGGAHLTATGPNALLYSSTGLANATLFSVAGADTILDLSALTEINAAFDDIYYDEVQTITATTGARINLSGLTKITGPVYSNDRLDIVMSGSTSTIDLPNLKSIVGAPTRFVLSGAATLNLPSLQSANNTLFALSGGAHLTATGPNALLYSSTGLANATLFSVAGADTVLNLSALTEINAAFNDVYYDEVQTITATTGARINLSGLTKITGPVYSNDRLDIVMSGSTSTIDLPNLKSIVGAPTRFVLSGAATLNLPSLQSANNTLFALSGGAHLTATGPKALLYSSTGLANATLFSVAGADTILDLSALTEINAAFDDIYYDEVQTITATTGARINLSGLTKITGPVYSNDRLDILVSSGGQLNLAGAITGSSIFTLADPASILDLKGVTSLTRTTLTAANGATWILPAGWNPMFGMGVALTTAGTGSQFINLANLSLFGVTLTINTNAFTNQGVLNAQNGGIFDFNGSFRVDDTGVLVGATGGAFTVTGNLLGDTHKADLYAPLAAVKFDGASTAVAPQLLEAMSQDLGAVAAGFSGNFVYNNITLEKNNTYVQLVNRSDNAVGTSPEAVYTNLLVVPAGTTLDLNGLNLYARKSQISGTVIGTVTTVPVSALAVTSLKSTPSGFVLQLNRPIDASVLNLYDTETGGLGAADVTLVGATQGLIRGSLVVNQAGNEITFIKTGGTLAPGNYTVTLRSAANGFKDVNGELLDGNNDGAIGDNYQGTFPVAASNAVVVSIPDVTRGAGQPINTPTSSVGIPITLSNGAGVRSVSLTLNYNPALLSITAANKGASLPPGSDVQTNLSTPGQMQINITSPTALNAGVVELVKLAASVPPTATYRGTEVLDITNVTINNGAIAAVADDGLHVAAYFGDATGNGNYSALDGQRVLRVAAGLDSGFASYPLIDPAIISDITGNGLISALDATRVLQFAAGIPTPEIPPLPTLSAPAQAAPIAAADSSPTAGKANNEVPLLTNDTTLKSGNGAPVTNSLSDSLTLNIAQSDALSKSTGKEWLFYTI